MTVILIAVVVLGAGYYAYRRFGPPATAAAASEAQAAAAQSETKAPIGKEEQRLSELRDSLRDAYQPQQLARFSTTASSEGSSREAVFTLYETSIQTPAGKHDLTKPTKATVAAQSEILDAGRAALERMGEGIVITGPVGKLLESTADTGTPDDRLLFLLLEGDRWADSESCPRGQSDVANAFATAVNDASADSENVQTRRSDRINDLTGQIEEATREHAHSG